MDGQILKMSKALDKDSQNTLRNIAISIADVVIKLNYNNYQA